MKKQQCVQCGAIYSLKRGAPDECYICGCPLFDENEEIIEDEL